MLKKNIKMTISEYCQLKRNEITLKQIAFNRKLDLFATKILNSKHKKIIIFIIASGLLIMNSSKAFANPLDTSKIDNLGSTILGLVRTCGYWFCIILATKDIIAALMEGSTKQIGQIIVKYLTAFGAFYALPWIMDLIKELLS